MFANTSAIPDYSKVLPDELVFSKRYRRELFARMTYNEKRKFQVYMNLMYFRYLHSRHRLTDPERFWIEESKYALLRTAVMRKMALMKKKKL